MPKNRRKWAFRQTTWTMAFISSMEHIFFSFLFFFLIFLFRSFLVCFCRSALSLFSSRMYLYLCRCLSAVERMEWSRPWLEGLEQRRAIWGTSSGSLEDWTNIQFIWIQNVIYCHKLTWFSFGCSITVRPVMGEEDGNVACQEWCRFHSILPNSEDK